MKIITKFYIGLSLIGILTIITGILGTSASKEFDHEISRYQTQQVPLIGALTATKINGLALVASTYQQVYQKLSNPNSTANPPAQSQQTASPTRINETAIDTLPQPTHPLRTDALNALKHSVDVLKNLENSAHDSSPLNSIHGHIDTILSAQEQLLSSSQALVNYRLDTQSITLNILENDFINSTITFINAVDAARTDTIDLLQNQQQLLQKQNAKFAKAIQSSGIMIFISLILLALFFKLQISNPFKKLSEGVNTVRRGYYDTKVDVRSNDELGKMAMAFNLMTHEVKHLIDDRNKVMFIERERANELAKTNQRLKSTQDSLIQSSKLASIGELASGVGHELNNPLFVVMSAAEQIRIHCEQNGSASLEEIIEFLDMIDSHCDRMDKIIKHLNNFSRKSTDNFTDVDVNQVIQSSFTLLNQQLILRNIKVIKNLSTDKPRIYGDANLLEQVLINLLNNARDAIESMDQTRQNRSISVSSEVHNNEVIIKVADTGPGIANNIKDKIFDAFYSTKPIGKGTGLGLSISHSIIEKQHHGQLTCQSIINQGTLFTIRLPQYQAQ